MSTPPGSTADLLAGIDSTDGPPNIEPSNPVFPFVSASLFVFAGSMHLLGIW